MATESIHVPTDQNLDYQMVAHIIDGLRKEQKILAPFNARLKMHTELRTLTFWRQVIARNKKLMNHSKRGGWRWKIYVNSGTHQEFANLSFYTFYRAIISECMASFLYVFIVCGAAAGAGIGASVSSVLLSTSLASGLAIAVLTHCFLHVSGKKCFFLEIPQLFLHLPCVNQFMA